MTRTIFVLTTGLATTACLAAFAHEGVKNPVVMERMEGMKSVAEQMKTLGQMAKGEIGFDAEKAKSAGTAIAGHAAEVPALFEAPEMDPKSEAKPVIWENWLDFTKKNTAFESAAQQAAQIDTQDDLRAAMRALGDSCNACHEVYRIER